MEVEDEDVPRSASIGSQERSDRRQVTAEWMAERGSRVERQVLGAGQMSPLWENEISPGALRCNLN